METFNHGSIRGGGNEHARYFLHIIGSSLSSEEMLALFVLWNEEFGIKGYHHCGTWCYPINSRREFALVPALIRKAERLGYDVSTSMWDVGVKDYVRLSQDAATFWKVLAMAQAFYRE